MSHSAFRDRLVALAGTTSQDPAGFLEGLADIHDDWHAQSPTTYGFLLFHNRVVRYFNAIVVPVIDPAIEPFTDQQFQDMGAQPFQGDLANVDTLEELVTFSTSIRSWHNTTHMAIGIATGTPMMDPRQNIFFRPFWQLHFYIDDLFGTTLERYGNQGSPQPVRHLVRHCRSSRGPPPWLGAADLVLIEVTCSVRGTTVHTSDLFACP